MRVLCVQELPLETMEKDIKRLHFMSQDGVCQRLEGWRFEIICACDVSSHKEDMLEVDLLLERSQIDIVQR